MASVTLCGICARYGKVEALRQVDLHVSDGAFHVIFGPAGAGKTTLLNAIAGIKEPTKGEVTIGSIDVTNAPVWERNVAMVFENYALYPHMSTFENMASPLRRLRLKEADIKQAVTETAQMLQIDQLLGRKPGQMSNGQRQRVAMGRAMVRSSHVLLMDEPLAHLDAKLRNNMRLELRRIQQQLGRTVIYVTHDFREALSLGTEITILREGAVVQTGIPEELYYTPDSTFVSDLFGDPPRSLVRVRTKRNGEEMGFLLGNQWLGAVPTRLLPHAIEGDECIVGFSASAVRVTNAIESGISLKVVKQEPKGHRNVITGLAHEQEISFYVPPIVRFGLESTVRVDIDLQDSLLFEVASGRRLSGKVEVNAVG